MMNKYAVALLALGLSGSLSHAQGPAPYSRPNPNPNNPYSRPIFSPYLNLSRGAGTVPGINYAGIVRPEFQTQSDISQVQQQLYQNSQAIAQAEETNAGGLNTGHPTQFLNLSHYYRGGTSTGGVGRGSGSAITPTFAIGQQGSSGGRGGATGPKPARGR
ncbi:MAG: hypothetical protein K2R98_05695 [Gemmataceae bacterium]|nr:hypothetical protein [Gemmataceae bacterium]